MSIEFRCPACNTLIRTPSDSAGKHARCPQCSGIVLVPGKPTNGSAAAESFQPNAISVAGKDQARSGPAPAGGNPFADRPSHSMNPYAAPPETAVPNPFHALSPFELAERARSRLLPPAIAMIVFSAMGLLLMAMLGVMASLEPDMLFREAGPDPAHKAGVMLFIVGYFGLGFVTRAVQILGALAMLRRSSYKLAFAGALCALVPCEVYCCVPNLLLGIWALIVLSNAAVKAAFAG